jgi:hypothetical protein
MKHRKGGNFILKFKKLSKEYDYLIQSYGEIIYSLCIINSKSDEIKSIFRSILKKLLSKQSIFKNSKMERSIVLKISCLILIENKKNNKKVIDYKKLWFDEKKQTEQEIFYFYFDQLDTEEKIILFLREKYKIQFFEIATALFFPEGTIKIKRQQAFEKLEEYLWRKKSKCFQFQNKILDHLENTLPEKDKISLKKHIQECKNCHYDHLKFKEIIDCIQKIDVETPSYCKSLFFLSPWNKENILNFQFSKPWIHWNQLPLLSRLFFEFITTVGCIFLGISSFHKINSFYIESFNAYSHHLQEETLKESLQSEMPLTLTTQMATKKPTNEMSLISKEILSSEKRREATNSELWRFTLKTVSPEELRPFIVGALKNVGVASNTPGIQGTEVPGGIEFDLILSPTLIAPIKKALPQVLKKFTDKNLSLSSSTRFYYSNNNFSWYRVKSKEKLPEGRSQVIIWVSQPNE